MSEELTPPPFGSPRVATTRSLPCIVCGRIHAIESTTTPHPEAPEMLRAPPGVRIGCLLHDNGRAQVIVTCDRCVDPLLSE